MVVVTVSVVVVVVVASAGCVRLCVCGHACRCGRLHNINTYTRGSTWRTRWTTSRCTWLGSRGTRSRCSSGSQNHDLGAELHAPQACISLRVTTHPRPMMIHCFNVTTWFVAQVPLVLNISLCIRPIAIAVSYTHLTLPTKRIV